jgi:Ca2+-binding RTX toxin-like protein
MGKPKTMVRVRQQRVRRRWRTGVAAVASATLVSGLLALTFPPSAGSVVAPVGQGFTVTAGDLAFILKQIKIAEHHSNALLTDTPPNPNKIGDPEYCSALLGRGADQVPDVLTSYGLRTVDGSCNNLKTGNESLAAADQTFPRLTNPTFRDAEPITAAFPVGPPGPTSYKQKLAGNVVIDSQPRVISNLIVDQTSTNPAAVAAAAVPVRAQHGSLGTLACTTDPDPTADPPVVGVPTGCVPSHQTLFIPNVTTDVGLSPPYNSLFTFFGQFFDHGVDQTVKSGATVFVPLRADDPLRTLGPDGKANTGDEVPPSQAFMVLTRAQNQPGPDGVLGTADDITDATNTDTPWVDNSQTYASHASHQVFLREYANNSLGRPVSTGKLLGGLPAGQTYANSPDGQTGIGTWAAVKQQAAQLLGLQLVDTDVTNVPMIATDPYGKFVPGPLRGLPQYVTTTGLVEGDTAAPVLVPANVLHFETPFLTDIAHNADPSERDTNNDGIPDTFPTPDADNTPSADFAHQPANTYDDEMLNAHFVCGDGRCNENIALSTIHQVFHSEHNRLIDYVEHVLQQDAVDHPSTGVPALAEWKLANVGTPDGWNGERLFQAARFVNEMEYQHAVFEEFARKVQPAVRPFHVYSPDINPAIKAEFAHAVYRFGHSMLDDTVARTNVDAGGVKHDNSVPLLTAFLNPPEFFNGGAAGTLTPEQAAGSVVMGSSDQTGNELDEFVTETLRNNLLGLPLDLPTLNLTRARDAGVPPLNDVRRQIHAATNDAQLAPYTSWADFGQHLKHQESLINFVAAYGTHPTIRDSGPDGVLGTPDDVTTAAAKRAAARAIVDPFPGNPTATPPIPADVPPADAAAFMFGTGDWADSAGLTTTGLDDVDLWVGGLAEVTNLNGGLLGSTFNYVFQNQLENLQDGDRLYYLARTPGLNLRTQLEGNSFAELIQRNTDGTNTLKADAFATADCKFQLANLNGTPAGFVASGSTVADDPTTDCDESKLLLRKPDGTIAYRLINSVNPSGINGQSVYNGTSGADRINGGVDNDTFWGGAGNDVIEGAGGDDVVLGGDGNDVITDLDGADVLKGGPGNDAIDAGPGNDIVLGGDGADFLNGGGNDNETFAGPGNDFIIAGQGADSVFGDGGDDWIEGGTGQDLLQGDHGAPFFDDPGEPAPGNDIFIGQPGENDYDAEGGDDVMAQNAAIDRNAGAGGFDWAFHQFNTVAADDDMMINNNLGGLPIQVIVNRDRWQETEADSGGPFNDVIKGTDGVLATPRLIGGGGFQGCDALDQAGVARIAGLGALLPPVASWLGTAAQTAALSTGGVCPLSGPVWGEGDILLGGGGSDTFTGRAGDEIIDGDRSLEVHITVRTNPTDPTSEIGRTDLMENKATSGTFGPGTAGMTLQQAVFAGLVDTGNLVAVREIVTPATVPAADCGSVARLNCDTAVFVGPRARYVITANANGTVTVRDTTSAVPAPGVVVKGDGTDTLRNIEALQFTDQTVLIRTPGAPTLLTATASAGAFTSGTATVTWSAPAANGSPAVSSYLVTATPTGVGVAVSRSFASSARTGTVTGLVNGTTYTLQVRALNLFGQGPASAASSPVTPMGLPGAPTGVAGVRGNASVALQWTAPVSDGGSAITGYQVQVRIGATVVRTDNPVGTATSYQVTGLTNGTAYTFRVLAVNGFGASAASATSASVTPATTPDRPITGAVSQGNAGGQLTATFNWTPPASNGGSAITSYTVRAYLAGAVAASQTVTVASNSRSRVFTFSSTSPVEFDVVATNAVGDSPPSVRSAVVIPR